MEFNLKNNKGMNIARIKYLGNGDESRKDNEVVILSGSLMKKEVKRSKKWEQCPWIDRSRREIINEGIVEDHIDEYYVLTRDKVVSSPNLAACICLGYITTKAWHEFKNDNGDSLHTIYRTLR